MSRIIGAILVGVLGGGCCMAIAAEPHVAGDVIRAATSAYAELDFEKALGLARQAERTEGNSRDLLVRIYHLEGLCLGALERYQEARTVFHRLLTLEPAFRLGADISPRVRKPFEEARRTNPRRLEVRSVPPAGAWKGEVVGLAFVVASDPAGMLRSIRIWYKTNEQQKYRSIRAPLRGRGRHIVNLTVPAIKGDKGRLEWYAVAEGEHYSRLQQFGDARHPAVLEIVDRDTLAAAPSRPWYKQWWVWTIVGGVVVAGATTAAVLATRPANNGPFDFTVDFSTAQ